MPRTPECVRVSVVYALASRQTIVSIELPRGSTVARAIEASGLSRRFPQIHAEPLNCAIFGRSVPLDQVLEEADRVEILRSLLVDPKEGRRQAALRSRSGNRSG